MHRRRNLSSPPTFTSLAPSKNPTSVHGPSDKYEGAKEHGELSPVFCTLLRRLWRAAAPYWSSDDKVQAWLRLAAVFALTLATTGINLAFNFLGRDFYNALANKDKEQFMRQLLYCLGGFIVGIPILVLRDYATEALCLRWRYWMTKYYLQRYFKNRTYYRIQSHSAIDNPDQRIVDDLKSFTSTALSLSLKLFNSVVDLISFSKILYGIHPPLFVALVVYSLGGTAISLFLGRALVTLNFMQEKKEADFRYGLVRVRENAESIAFYGGEENEIQILLQRFTSAFVNLSGLLICSRNLEFFTCSYRYLIQILPAAVVAPLYFSGQIELGVINQSVSAFKHILRDFSLIVYQIEAISSFSAVINRLGEFDDALDHNNISEGFLHNPANRITISNLPKSTSCEKLLEIENLTLQISQTRTTLIRDLSLEINDKDRLLITGPSGCGKTSLMRAIAGLWETGGGKITFYLEGGDTKLLINLSDCSQKSTIEQTNAAKNVEHRRDRSVFFLPQRPYMVLGTLSDQLLYPTWTQEGPLSILKGAKSTGIPSEKDLLRMLETVCLGDVVSKLNGLDSVHDWSNVLSLGEQQRLAFARLLLAKPKLVLLDESTSALDESNEAHLYKQIQDAGITYISIGHRQTLHNFHNRTLDISKIC